MIFREYIRALTPSLGLRSLGRWVVYGVLIGIVSGLGAALFNVILSAVGWLAFDVLAGAPLSHPKGEQGLFHSTGPVSFVP